jgi:hypothetical protein
LLVVKQDLEQMKGCELLVSLTKRQGLSRLDKATRAFGQFFDIHFNPPKPASGSQLAGPQRLMAPNGGLNADMGNATAGWKSAGKESCAFAWR